MFEYFDNKVILSKDFQVSDFPELFEKVGAKKLDFVVLTKTQAANDQFMANLYFMFPNTPLLVSKSHYELDETFTLSQKEMANFSRTVSSAKTHGNKVSVVDLDTDFEIYSPYDLIQASFKIETFTQNVTSAKCIGSGLTPFEKYLYAYQFVTSFGVDLKGEKQSVIHGVESGKLNEKTSVELLFELCKKLNIPCMQHVLYLPKTNEETKTKEKIEYDKTSVCLVYLKDHTYGIDGLYVAYPSFDMGSFDGLQTVHHSLMTYKDFTTLLGYEFYLNFTKLDLKTINRLLQKMSQSESVDCKMPDLKQIQKIVQDLMAIVCLDVSPFLLDEKDKKDEHLIENLAKRAEEYLNVKQVPRILDETPFARFVAEEYDSADNYIKRVIRKEPIELADDAGFVERLARDFYAGYNIDFEALAKSVLKERNIFQVPEGLDEKVRTLIENSYLLDEYKVFRKFQSKAETIELNDYLMALTNIEVSKGLDMAEATDKAMQIIAKSEQFAKLLWRNELSQNPFLQEIVHSKAISSSKILH